MNIAVLLNQLIGHHLKLKVVKVGANDGVLYDPTYELLKIKPDWPVLYIEPNPTAFQRLKANVQGTLVNAAVSDAPGTRTMYVVTPDAEEVVGPMAPLFDTLSSFDKATIIASNTAVKDYIGEIEVPCDTLPNILELTGFTDPDVVLIDCEGYDFEIVKQIEGRPKIILFEHRHLTPEDKEAAREWLRDRGYNTLELEHDLLGMAKP